MGKLMAKALKRHLPGEMNKTEAAYARHLEARAKDGEVMQWWFESAKLRVGHNCHYTPDFMVVLADGEIEFHEVKGARAIFQDDAKVKIRACANKYAFRFLVAFPRKGGGWDIEDFTE